MFSPGGIFSPALAGRLSRPRRVVLRPIVPWLVGVVVRPVLVTRARTRPLARWLVGGWLAGDRLGCLRLAGDRLAGDRLVGDWLVGDWLARHRLA